MTSSRRIFPARWRTGLRVERLEDRVTPAYSATLSGATATFTGNSSGNTGDVIIFSQSGGLLAHSRGAFDPGFDNSGGMGAFDFDSTLAGVQTLAASAASTVVVTTGAGPDSVQFGVTFGAFSARARDLLAAFQANSGGISGQTLRVDDSAAAGAAYTVSASDITGAGVNVFRTGVFESVQLDTGAGADTVNVTSGTPGERYTIQTGAGDDSIVFAAGATAGGGSIDGGANTDTLDFSAHTTPVAVNLGLGVAGLAADLDGGQEVPAQATATATGTATVSNYSVPNKTFDLVLTVADLNPADVTGLHLHRGAVGANGPVVLDLLTLGTLVPAGTGFTLTLTGVDLDAALLGGAVNEAAFLGGQTYLNVHTAAAPNGLIRGQLFSTGNVNLTDGTAAGAATVRNVENAVGGSGADGLVGSFAGNVLTGGDGNDTLVGGPGADTFTGGPAAATLLGIDAAGTGLVRFSAATPGTVTATIPVSGLVGGETLVGIDVRPATGALYGLTSQSRLYVIDPATGAAVLASTLSTPLSGTAFGIDFNPVPDRLRVVTDADQNLRVNVDTGAALVDTPLAYAAADPNAGANPNATAAGYTNSVAGATATTLYVLDTALDVLATQSPPNNGTLNTVGALGVDASEVTGFDILPGGTTALAVLTVGGTTGLYAIDLATGAATPLGAVGGGAAVRGLAALPDNDTLVWSNGDGSDVMDGGVGADTVAVNGNVANPDTFTVGANAARVAFARTSAGPFSLDIGTAETLIVNGIGGDDSFTVNTLTGVADLTAVRLNGFAGTDTFNVTPAATAAVTATGGGPVDGDTLVVDTAGTASPAATSTPGALGLSGAYTFGDRATVSFAQLAAATPTAPAITSASAATFATGAAGTFTVTTSGTAPVSLTAGPTLPPGVTFTDNGNGTATLAGTPTAAGAFPITITAAGAIGPTAVQSFTLTVTVAPTPPAPPATPAPAAVIVVVPAGPVVNVFAADGTFVRALTPFAGFPVGSAATADVTGDGVPDVLAAAAPGGAAHVKAFDGATGAELVSIFAFAADFRGGATVAAGDVTGDGTPDLIVGAGPGGGPHVKVFDGKTGAEVRSFFAFGVGFAGGVNVGAGDVTGDGVADIVVGAGPGAGPHVKVFDGTTLAELASFFAFGPGFGGGVRVAAADVNGDGFADVITGVGPGAGPHVKAFDARTQAELLSFFAFAPDVSGGVTVGTADVNGDGAADLVASSPGRPTRVFDLPELTELESLLGPGV